MDQYIIEELNGDGSRERILATADNAVIGRVAFETACQYLPNATIRYRYRARVISMRNNPYS